MRNFAAFLLASLLSLPVFAGQPGERVQFAFHSHFLLNLHHFLYDSATLGKYGPRVEWQAVSDPADKAALEQAAAHYSKTYARSDVFDPDMDKVKLALSVAADDRQTLAGLALAPELAAVLERAAPAYARSIWPIHDRANRQWIRQVTALDAVFGQQVESAIERHLRHGFPSKPARIDVVFQTGDRLGAYTSDDEPMQTVMPSARADYQGLAALEMLYHEVTHMRVNAAVIDAINSSLKAAGREDDKGLWHAVHFYTVGAAVKDAYQKRGIAYLPYADQAGIYSRAPFKSFAPLLADIWQPYMQGKSSFDQATRAMAAALP
jgi:hypothetical protein